MARFVAACPRYSAVGREEAAAAAAVVVVMVVVMMVVAAAAVATMEGGAWERLPTRPSLPVSDTTSNSFDLDS
ncbi:hypothetical protein E2C01_001462 [Portunus trituberculatus]|uniref:Uncharacterized protein n=1 Tax=Portunus trituberculatus TaxID=210409 RepID=A0A5B7CKH7_PORTR|nr:hypothetical protein [Portunus trituberculatus]